MVVTKYGHCCLLLESGGKRILTDPGMLSVGMDKLTNLDVILITHEHADHLHTASLQEILSNNPQAKVVSNASVGKILSDLGITFTAMEDQDEKTVSEVTLKAYEGKHEEIVGDFGLVQNTGFLVDGQFFYPGDSYIVPTEKLNILAVPVAGPWCKVSEAIAYALAVVPAQAIPVHDGLLTEQGRAITYPHFARELEAKGIKFQAIENNQTFTFTEQ